MSEASGGKSWWTTLPGILTQVVALITALTGLITALYQSGFFGQQGEPPSRSTAAQTVSQAGVQPHIAAIPEPASSAASGPPAQAAAPIAPPSGAFAIKIGDTISEGVPAIGAGKIESPGTEDVYQFSAAPNQRVYFRMLQFGKGMDYLKWRLTDEDAQEIFNTCLGCSEPGMQTLSRGGVYLLTVGNTKEPATGTYKLRLTHVPPADRFGIAPSSRIGKNMPGPGAGTIEVPGASDQYLFNAAAGQRVYFRMREHGPNMDYLKWRLTDQDEQEIFNSCLGCSEPGMQTLSRGGAYLLTVGNPNDPATGVYRLELTTP
jgi:hypothetical protein